MFFATNLASFATYIAWTLIENHHLCSVESQDAQGSTASYSSFAMTLYNETQYNIIIHS